MKNVAILGATSHVAKNLIHQNSKSGKWKLSLFARNTDSLNLFVSSQSVECSVFHIDSFGTQENRYDAVINCVGFGTPEKVTSAGYELFLVAESIDKTITDYILKNPETLCVNFSSGAVYGTGFNEPVDGTSKAEVSVSPIVGAEYYGISKMYQEAKHRSLSSQRIVDLRLFSFFSRYIDLESKYFMADVVRALKSNSALRTSKSEMYRDYISPSDLYELVNSLINTPDLNCSIDLVSKSPIGKFELLANLTREFGLKVTYEEASGNESPTGNKQYYYSENFEDMKLAGFESQLTSWDTISSELRAILADYRGTT